MQVIVPRLEIKLTKEGSDATQEFLYKIGKQCLLMRRLPKQNDRIYCSLYPRDIVLHSLKTVTAFARDNTDESYVMATQNGEEEAGKLRVHLQNIGA